MTAYVRGELDTVLLAGPSGASAGVTLQGAQVVSWVPAAGVHDVLFVGSDAEFRPGRTIRGGIPVVFPQFAELGPLPKHGIVRAAAWELHEVGGDRARLTLASDDATRELWMHEFRIAVAVVVMDAALEVRLDVRNEGSRAFSFTCALHTYLRVGDVHHVRMTGLCGAEYLDKTRANSRVRDEEGELTVTGELDRVYPGLSQVVLRDPVLERAVRVGARGFSDLVIWNPGAARVHEFSGLSAHDYRNFICIEPAVATAPVTLEPARTWSGTQRLSVQPLAPTD